MADLTPEVLAERRAFWTELRDRGGQDVILTPEFALALLDKIAKIEADRDKFLKGFIAQFDLREEYEAECKKLWTNIEALANIYAEADFHGVAEAIRGISEDDDE